MQDIYNERTARSTTPSPNSAVLFTADFDLISNHPSGVTLLTLTTALRELLHHNTQKQIAIYISNTTINYSGETTQKSSTLSNTLSGLISFIKSYQEINTSFIIRGTLGWEFIPLLSGDQNVFITNGTTLYLNREQLPLMVTTLHSNRQLLHNVVDLLADNSSTSGVFCDYTKMKQLGFNVQQYN